MPQATDTSQMVDAGEPCLGGGQLRLSHLAAAAVLLKALLTQSSYSNKLYQTRIKANPSLYYIAYVTLL